MAETANRPFQVVIDHELEIIRIQGMNYAFSLFDTLAYNPVGGRFEIGKRIDGVVHLIQLGPVANEIADGARPKRGRFRLDQEEKI